MSAAIKHEHAARDHAYEAHKLLQTHPDHPERSQDDLLGALRHSRNCANQIIQALTARRMEARDAHD